MSEDPEERSDFEEWAYRVLLMAYGPLPTEVANTMRIATRAITDFVIFGPKGAPVARGLPVSTEEYEQAKMEAGDPMMGILADIVIELQNAINYIETYVNQGGENAGN